MKTLNSIEDIKKERLSQRDNPVIYKLLGVLLGELDRLPTRANPTSDQIYNAIKKLHESAEIMKLHNAESEQEYTYLSQFIKQQMSESQIRLHILDLKNMGYNNIGSIMKYFKDYYSGQYDGKVVSKLVKEMLS